MFVNPWYLALLPLAALPVIIHMIHRQKYRIFNFSTLLFFDRSRKYNVFRMRLRHILLMCLRIAAVLFILFAFSRLAVSGLGIGDKQQAVVLVLDGSYSMTQAFGTESALEFAKEQALKSIEEMGPGARVGIVSTHPSPQLVLRPTSDRDAVRQALQSVEPFYTRGSSWAAARLGQGLLENLRTSSKEVVVFTDFQECAWGSRSAGDGSGAAKGGGAALLSDIPMKIISLRPRFTENLAIVSLDAQRAPVTVGRPARFAPTIRSFTDKDVKGLRIRAGLGAGNEEDAVAAETVQVDVPPRGTVRANFFFTFSMPGPQGIWFEIDDDALLADNRWHEAVSVTDTTPVLCLGDRAGEEDRQGTVADDLFYLSNALAPTGRSNNVSLVISPVRQLAQMGLYGYGCVFLSAVKELGEKEARLLRQYVSRGGGLVVFLGAGTEEASIKTLLAQEGTGRLVPVEVKDVVREPARIAHVDFHQSAAGQALAHLADQLKGVSYTTRYEMSLGKGSEEVARPLALFDDGAPAIIEARYGFGRCVLFAGGCSAPGTDFQFRAIFPALMQEMARRLGQAKRDATGHLEPSEFFAASFEEAERPKSVKAVTPHAGAKVVSVREGESDYSMWFGETSAPGYYELQATYGEDERETAIHGFAVNTGGADSDLRAATAQDVAARFPNVPISVHAVDKPSLQNGLLATNRRDLMRILLLIVLAIVVAENLISWVTK